MKKLIFGMGAIILGASIGCAGVYIDNNSNNPMDAQIVSTTSFYALNGVTDNDANQGTPPFIIVNAGVTKITVDPGKGIYLTDPKNIGQNNILFEVLNNNLVDVEVCFNSSFISTTLLNDVTFSNNVVNNGKRYIIEPTKTTKYGETIVPIQDTVDVVPQPQVAISNTNWQLAENCLLYTEQVKNDIAASVPTIETPIYVQNALADSGFIDSVRSVLQIPNNGAFTLNGELTGLINNVNMYNGTRDQTVKNNYTYMIEESSAMVDFYMSNYLSKTQVQ